ncbi:hypothetical protein V3C99_005656 [Haemonchus contortus]
MALLQSNSDNIIPAENGAMEGVDGVENAKKVVEAEEAKGDAKEIIDTSDKTVEKPTEQNDAVEENAMDTTEKKPSQDASPKEQPSKEEKADEEMPQETPGKTDKAEEAEDEEEGDDEEGEHEQKKGIYDMPLEVEGKRERHKVERITIATPTPKKTVVRMGDGVPLGEIAYIEDQLHKKTAEELKIMHKVLYGNPGKATTLKREIRKFKGFAFEEDSPEFKKKVALLNKLTSKQLATIKNVLGLHSGGQSKDAVVTTIMVFLMKTVDHARRVPGGKKRKSSGKTPTSAKRSKKAKGDDEILTESDDEDDDDEKPPAKTPAKTPAKATTKTPAKSAKTPKKAATTKTPRKKRESSASKETASKTDSDSDDSDTKKKKSKKASKKDSDDETSSSSSVETQKEKEVSPTDKELEAVIEELLSQVDLSQVSMKQMCQAVIEKFPGTNIGTRVDYLKGKIKQSLSSK